MNATNATGAYTRKIASIKAQSIVEIKFTEQDLGEAVAVSPQVSLQSAEVTDGKVLYGGRLVCTVVCADGDRLARVQKGAEFSHKAEDDRLAPSQFCNCALQCARTSTRRDGSGFIVSVVISAEITVYDSAERTYIQSLEGAVSRREEGKLFSAVCFSGESDVEDSFGLVATDILMPSATAAVTSCNVGTGVIEVAGEIYLSLLAVRDGSPLAAERVVPFKAEISSEQAVMPCPACCRAEIKDMSVDCKINEDRGKCDVGFSATLAFYGTFFEEEDVSLVTDAFHLEKELDVTYNTESNPVWGEIKVYSERVLGPCATKAKLDYTCAFLAAALPHAEYSKTDDGLEGAVYATLIYGKGGEVHSTEAEMPFSVKLAGLKNCPYLSVAVLGTSIRQRAEGECEAEAVLKISAAEAEEASITYLTSVKEGTADKPQGSAISVCIPAAGEDLWQTAKRLNVPPESIEASNPELKYPLSGKERIIIFRQKT